MLLDDISEKYSENLRTFFSDPQVIEEIYKEQYGEKDYTANSVAYQEQYNEIINNTVFIPYITIDHLSEFLELQKKAHGGADKGEEYVQKHYSRELREYRRLNAKRAEIIKQYTTELFAALDKILPNNNITSNKLLEDMQGVQKIESLINEYIQNNNRSFSSRRKNKKIQHLLKQFKKELEEKILIETSTYFKHKRDIPQGKYFTDVLKIMREGMIEGKSRVIQSIGKDESRNCRCIFLPVLSFTSEQEYLKFAVHEMMHISKEKIEGNKYRSGLLVRNMSENKNQGILQPKGFLQRLIEGIKSLKLLIRLKAENIDIQTFESGDTAFEEVTHQWGVNNVIKRLKQLKLTEKIIMPYSNDRFLSRQHIVYEAADQITGEFMSSFGTTLQEVNSGEMPLSKFKKRIVGVANFALLGQVFSRANKAQEEKGKNINASIQEGKAVAINDIQTINPEYAELGHAIISEMIQNARGYEKRKQTQAARRQKREAILAKTKKILGMDVIEAGKSIMQRLKERTEKGDNQLISEINEPTLNFVSGVIGVGDDGSLYRTKSENNDSENNGNIMVAFEPKTKKSGGSSIAEEGR